MIGPSGQCRHFRPESGCPDEFACVSAFMDDEQREGAYWAHRDTLVVVRCEAGPWAGTRPWGWWRYEAAAACSHRPVCDRPDLLDHEAQAAWLEDHGVIGVRERALLARRVESVDG